MTSCDVVEWQLNISCDQRWRCSFAGCLYHTANIPVVYSQPHFNFSPASWGSSKLTWFFSDWKKQHLQTERHNTSLYLALPRYVSAVIPDGYGPHKSSLILSESLRKSNKAGVSASKPSFCHLPIIQIVQVYTSQHNALSLYTALLDMMCGSFVQSRHKSTFTECKTSDCPADTTDCVPSSNRRTQQCHCPLAEAIEALWRLKRHFINFCTTITNCSVMTCPAQRQHVFTKNKRLITDQKEGTVERTLLRIPMLHMMAHTATSGISFHDLTNDKNVFVHSF